MRRSFKIFFPLSLCIGFSQVFAAFQNVSFANKNERSVGENIDDLIQSGLISSDLTSAVNSLTGQSDAVINEALDQMHPAAMSAFAELQAELGGQLLSLFHRKPTLICGCSKRSGAWIEPFGNWLEEKQEGEEIGFDATTRGIALGIDHEFFGAWTVGIGGAYQATDLKWALGRGHGYTEGGYGAFYTDLAVGNFYFGGSVYVGKDWYQTARQIQFTTIDRKAEGHHQGLDVGGQFTSAYYFGTPLCLFYPYGTIDFLYLDNESFSESGADSLSLSVGRYTSSTLRSEAGLALQFIDKNYYETICVSPLFAFGWVMEMPLHRSHYTSTFSGEPLSFTTSGWNRTWQLLNLRFGLGLTYRCFTLDSQYILDISPDGGSPFFNQRANFRLSLTF